MSAPTCISPEPIRLAPNQTAATLDRFTVSITVGNMNAMSRPVRSAVSVSSSFAVSNRTRLVGLADEGADDAHPGDLLAQDLVHTVDARLHRA